MVTLCTAHGQRSKRPPDAKALRESFLRSLDAKPFYQIRVPSWIVSRCQSILTEEWQRKLPLIQPTSPANIAADIISQVVDQLDTIAHATAISTQSTATEEDSSTTDPPSAAPAPAAAAAASAALAAKHATNSISIIDFCSGAGGPTPTIERIINAQRAGRGQPPIPFVLSDLRPHFAAWKQASRHSQHLSYIGEPVDAANPPPVAVSASLSSAATRRAGGAAAGAAGHDEHVSRHDYADADAGDGSDRNGNSTADNTMTDRKHLSSRSKQQQQQQQLQHKKKKKTYDRIFRLFALSFHHFTDAQAAAVLQSTLATSHAFCILELQDRRLFSIVLTLSQFALVLLTSWLWFWHDIPHLMMTYWLPILPFVMAFDGVVSALRTREFEEVVRLIEDGDDGGGGVTGDGEIGWTIYMMHGRREAIVSKDGVIWRLQAARRIHTWPFGYANWISGVRFRS